MSYPIFQRTILYSKRDVLVRDFIKKTGAFLSVFWNTQLNTLITNHQKYNKLIKFIHKIDLLKIWDLANTFRGLKKWNTKFNPQIFTGIDFNQFDAIHFHICYHVLSSFEILKGYKGVKILTSHSPQPLSDEFCTCPQLYSPFNKVIARKLRPKELKAWNSVDYMMFPVQDATEVYFSDSSLKEFIQTNKDRLLFCPTALNDNVHADSGRNIRKDLKIPEDAFVLTYIGRHNLIKGYDQLLNIGNTLLHKYKNLYIVIAGNESPLFGLKHPRWIELGWINYGRDLIAQSDSFILPNKDTYFDLIALEVLREGTPIILSYTGGNRYFNQFRQKEREGMFFYDYDNPSEIEGIIDILQKKKKSSGLSSYRESNILLFKEHFTMPVFVSTYKSVIYKLLNCKKK